MMWVGEAGFLTVHINTKAKVTGTPIVSENYRTKQRLHQQKVQITMRITEET